MLLSTLLGPNSNSALDKHYYLRLLVLTVTKKHERNTSGNSNNCASLGCNSCSHHVLLHLCITSYEWKKPICQCSNSGQCTCLEETQYWLKTQDRNCIVKWWNYDSLLIYSSKQYPPPTPLHEKDLFYDLLPSLLRFQFLSLSLYIALNEYESLRPHFFLFIQTSSVWAKLKRFE